MISTRLIAHAGLIERADGTGRLDYGRAFMLALVLVTGWRVLVLLFAAPELGPDETQYWHWSRDLAAGYYSKPPLIAWAIALTTALFGHAEWAVRLPAPIFQMGAAAFIFLTARQLYDDRAGLMAGLSWALMPGVSLSSTLIATDAPLMCFASIVLYCLARLSFPKNTDHVSPEAHSAAAPRLISGVGLGVSLGLAFLSKYAAVYLVAGLVLAIVTSPAARRALLSPYGALAAVVAMMIAAPNILWNANHDFQTLSHTVDNANWGGSYVHPLSMLSFLGAQFAVAGPILFALGLFACAHAVATGRQNGRARVLLGFIAPALVLVTVQAFLSRAHANWAAASYPALVILTAGWATRIDDARPRVWRALKASNILHLLLIGGFSAVIVSAGAADGLGLAGSFKRLRGWAEQGAAIRAQASGFDAIMSDDREIMGGLIYYARPLSGDEGHSGADETTQDFPDFVAWNSNGRIDYHYEAFSPFRPEAHGAVLYVTTNADAIAVQGRFGAIRPIGETTADLGAGRRRTLYLFALSEFLPSGP